jgi:NAD(P)-dependent dehydrogenase (short-subunit alcohol dehydrogenase family)
MGAAQVTNVSLDRVVSQEGQVVIVTGGNAGIGFGTVKALASKGATVIIASRNRERVGEAVAKVKLLQPDAKVEGMVLDVSSFSSIDGFVAEVRSRYGKVDILINNAGIGMNPFVKTEQGFEPTLGTNVMGTAYLTNSLLPLISASSAGRVVFLSAHEVNIVHQKGVETFITDVGGERLTACTFEAYAVSKLFTCLYAYELQIRLTGHSNEAFNKIVCYVADPNVVRTEFIGKMEGGVIRTAFSIRELLIGDNIETGALCSVFCATSSDIPITMRGGAYMKGETVQAGPHVYPFQWTTKAYNAENSARVFDAVNAAIAVKGFRRFE